MPPPVAGSLAGQPKVWKQDRESIDLVMNQGRTIGSINGDLSLTCVLLGKKVKA